MQRKLMILCMLAGMLIAKNGGAQWCRTAGDFDGQVPFQSFLATSTTITLRWAGQSEYSNERYKIFIKHLFSDPWELVAGDVYGNAFKVEGLSSNTTYNFKIERWCISGAFIDAIPGIPSITTKDASFVVPNQPLCFGSIFGITSYSPGTNSITIYWSDDVFQGDSYRVFTRINDRFYGTTDVWGMSAFISTNSYTFSGLNPSTTYEFYVQKYCNNLVVGNSGFRTFTTLASGNNGSTFLGPVATITAASHSTANLTFWNHLFAFPGTRLDGFTVYVYTPATGWVNKGTIPAVANITTQYNYLITGLVASTKYNCIVAQNYTLNPGQSFQSSHSVFSNSDVFKTAPIPVGPCGGIAGNFTAPAINNTGGVNFYEGVIASASPVTLSTVQRRFTASAVVLNPGFVTAVSGNGNFIANAFNPANCVQSRTAGGATGQDIDASGQPLSSSDYITAGMLPGGRAQAGINVFPNPTAGGLAIQTARAGEVVQRFVITNAAGKIVFTAGSNKNNADISHLAAGLYFYTATTNERTYTGKIVKQ